MSVSLHKIIVYSHTGEKRVLQLNAAGLSIITGESKTGKSALIHLIDYCFGSDECHVPQGVIRRKVAWYAIVLFDGEKYLFIARRNPPQGRGTSSEIDVRFQSDDVVPAFGDLGQNATIESVKLTLARYVGLAENLFVPQEGFTRDSLEANFSHARIYCFQDQSLIDNKNQLFFMQQDSWVAQAIKDTLPYFVGAVSDTELLDQFELSELKRELRLLDRKLSAAVSWEELSLSRANALLAEARQVGLLPVEARAPTPADSYRLLQAAGSAELSNEVPADERTELDELMIERDALRAKYFDIGERIDEALLLSSSKDAYQQELSEQNARLNALSILPTSIDGPVTCPLCGTHVESVSDELQTLRQELAEVADRIAAIHESNPRLQKYIKDLRAERNAISERIAGNQAQINAIIEEQEALRRLGEQRLAQSRTQGRITSFLESKGDGDDEELRSQRSLLRYRIDRLESRLSGEEFEDRLRNAESNIADYMTAYARALELEHAEGRTRLDFRRLTVIADTPNGAIRLEQMGSGDNWVGCHVITHVALHRWFRARKRPVPAFLILDQPSKAHYPPSEEFEPNAVEDDDRVAVSRLFKFLSDRAAKDRFQIIVVDHADEPDSWFQDAVVERWRHGEKLVPDAWPEA